LPNINLPEIRRPNLPDISPPQVPSIGDLIPNIGGNERNITYLETIGIIINAETTDEIRDAYKELMEGPFGDKLRTRDRTRDRSKEMSRIPEEDRVYIYKDLPYNLVFYDTVTGTLYVDNHRKGFTAYAPSEVAFRNFVTVIRSSYRTARSIQDYKTLAIGIIKYGQEINNNSSYSNIPAYEPPTVENIVINLETRESGIPFTPTLQSIANANTVNEINNAYASLVSGPFGKRLQSKGNTIDRLEEMSSIPESDRVYIYSDLPNHLMYYDKVTGTLYLEGKEIVDPKKFTPSVVGSQLLLPLLKTTYQIAPTIEKFKDLTRGLISYGESVGRE